MTRTSPAKIQQRTATQTLDAAVAHLRERQDPQDGGKASWPPT